MEIKELIANMICEFCENHPILTWLLARLIICVCVCTFVGLLFFALVIFFVPFMDDGVSLAVWLWIPLIETACWLLCSIIEYVWQEVIE